jgi:hypothetical protein
MLTKAGQITRYPLLAPELAGPKPELPEPGYPILISDSDFDYPKLVWVIQVISPSTRTTRITQTFVCLCIYHVLLIKH